MKRTTKNRGFALVAALLANLILLAAGIIAINLSTADIRISMKTVGEKKAINAAESGLHWLTVNFDTDTYTALVGPVYQVDPSTDPNSRYAFDSIGEATTGPAQIPMPGFSIGGAQTWGLTRFDARITGSNTAYNTTASIDVGLGHGPVEMGTMSR